MKFTKMHSLGNDYVCINGFSETVSTPGKLAKAICDRHFGVGADGLLLIFPSDKADFKMELYNADGSRAQMCGNGIRCLGKYVYEHRMTDRQTLEIETISGLHTLQLYHSQGIVELIKADMGIPCLDARRIPILSEKDMIFQEPIVVCQKEFFITGVSMGNPHTIIFLDDLKDIPLQEWGFGFEFHPRFPERTNVEFCKILSSTEMQVRVWERGVGETLACGTGACAAVVAAVLNGNTLHEVTVRLPGGSLLVEWNENTNHVFLTGDANSVFEGTLNEKIYKGRV